MKTIKYLSVLFLSLLVFTACEEDEHDFGQITSPSNVQVTVDIAGADDINVNGDGTGFVTFTATANGALAYQFNFGDGNSTTNSSGIYTHRYTQVGTTSYTVIVSAVGTAGVLSSTTFDIEVYSSFQDAEAETFLAGANEGDSKTWVWDTNAPAYIGLGPVLDDYGNSDFSWPNWWNSIQPDDAEKACMTGSNVFVFTNTANGLTFEQTAGPSFVPGTYAGVIGVDGDTCHDESVATTMFGVKNVSFFPSSSKAALEGVDINTGEPYRQTAFKLSDGGFMGWYVGDVEYDIISITANTLHVRCIQEGGGFAWYGKYKVQ
ncbi:MAG: Uncharacterised protein [Formosa sp. Hel3_A1_48]|jgi:hypothetical protein|nr:MAG: Uncharacterised protein [Formosa sp. Hel3_A1_48]